jgi:hypothetical protein
VTAADIREFYLEVLKFLCDLGASGMPGPDHVAHAAAAIAQPSDKNSKEPWQAHAVRAIVTAWDAGREFEHCVGILETYAPSSASDAKEQAYQDAASAIGIVLLRGGFSDDCIRWTVEKLSALRDDRARSDRGGQ